MWNWKSLYEVVCFIQLSEAAVLSVFLKMDEIEYRAVKKLFVKEGLTPNKIHSKFINVYGDCSPSFSAVKKWAAEFKRGRTGLEGDPREGRPKSKYVNSTIDFIIRMHTSTALSSVCRCKTLLSLTLRRLMSYIYGAPILDVSRSHTTTQHSR